MAVYCGYEFYIHRFYQNILKMFASTKKKKKKKKIDYQSR